MPVLRNISQLAVCSDTPGQGDIGAISGGALVWEGEKIIWSGPESTLPEIYKDWEDWDARGCLVTPGLIDCHTHLAFGGWRADEFEQRILGVDYAAIAKKGGGILSTVRHTRESTEEELAGRCLTFLEEMGKLGVTTVECKSGYGLNTEQELKLLRVYKKVVQEAPQTIVATFLGAHVVPAEFRAKRQAYIDMVVNEMIPKVAREKLAEFCDVFVEEGAFEMEEARTILAAAQRAGLKPKLHVDQFSDRGGASFAAEMRAVSAGHLEYISQKGVEDLSNARTVGVVLPLASLYTFEPPIDARILINGGVPVAIATDYNPGSAPTYHLPLALTLACTMNRMTPAEALKGATIFAARAICREHFLGSLVATKNADFCIFDSPSVDHWLYHFRPNSCLCTVKSGRVISGGL